jgi:hypothetical protein
MHVPNTYYRETMTVKYAFICALSLLLSNHAFAVDAGSTLSPYRVHIYAWLLTARDPGRIKLGAKALEYDGFHDRTLSDLAAKVLWDALRSERHLDNDTIAWLIKGVGATHSSRYRTVLELGLRWPTKVAGHAKDELAGLRGNDALWDPDTVQIDATRAALVEQVDTTPLGDGALSDFHAGAWIDDVLTNLGYPTDVSVGMRFVRRPYAGSVGITNLALFYEGQGTVHFDRTNNDWYASAVEPIRYVEGVRAASGSYISGFLDSDPVVLRDTAKRAYHARVDNEPTLEVAATRLRDDMSSSDGQVVDALAHVCRILSSAKASRYRDLLQYVSEHAETSKLKKYARAAVATLPASEIEQFPVKK